MGLPEDVLHQLFAILTSWEIAATFSASLEATGNLHQSQTTPAQALRCTCRCLQNVSNSFRESIAFPAQRQREVEPFLCKLPHLAAVSISYQDSAFDVETSLYFLSNILPHLTSLTLTDNCCVEQLDVSSFTSLKVLRVINGIATHLNLSGLTALQVLECRNNKLAELDVSRCTALEMLTCSNNLLTALDVTACVKLHELRCSSNPLATLLLSDNLRFLQHLHCNDCSFTQLDLAACTSLKTLNMEGSEVSTLNLGDCTRLQYMNARCSKNLTSLDLSGLDELTYLGLGSSSLLTSLDVTGCTALLKLSCENSPALTSLCTAGCTSLQILSVYCCGLSAINLSECLRLKHIYHSGCPLSCLKLSLLQDFEINFYP